jgi:hypothetical protein
MVVVVAMLLPVVPGADADKDRVVVAAVAVTEALATVPVL